MAWYNILSRKKKIETLNDGFIVPINGIIPAQKEATITADSIKNTQVKKVGVAYVKNATTRDNFEGPTNINLNEISNAYLTDSYVRQSVDKHVDFLFKAGYDLIGKDQKSLEYIKSRIMAFELASGRSFESFMREASDDLVKYHNAFIVKIRQPGSYKYPGNIQAKGVYSAKPVAAYYLLPATSITIAREATGAVKGYRQQITGVTTASGEQYIDIKVEDMIHMYIDKPSGRAYGIPYIWEALDDVKILRHLEELNANMIYKNIYPLAVYTIGTDDAPAEDGEVDAVREMLGSDFTFDGGLVIPNRHKVSVEAQGSKGLDITSSLSYYKKRVFTGLGVSPTLMGEGDTSSRSTADTIDQGFKDRIKSYQREEELIVDDSIIKELLLEGGIDFITNPDSMVYFKFREIDLSSKIQNENHSIQLFTQNAITHPEMRRKLGMEELADADFELTYSRLITAFIDAKKAEDANAAANASGENKDQPANASGKKLAPGTKASLQTAEMFSGNLKMDRYYNSLKSDVITTVCNSLNDKDLTFYSEYDIITLEMVMSLAINNIREALFQNISNSFMQGILDVKKDTGTNAISNIRASTEIKKLKESAGSKFNILISEIKNTLTNMIHMSDENTLKKNLEHVFNAAEYRMVLFNNNEPAYAYNLAYRNTAKILGFKKIYIQTEDKCEKCNEKDFLEIDDDNIPPFHANCKCKLVIKKEEIQ